MKVFSGSSNQSLSEKIAKHLSLQLSQIEQFVFPDGERRIKLNDQVLDEDTIIVQSTATPVDQNYIELFLIIDALRRSGAKSVTVVIPYLGYQRQDHIFRDGESVSLQVMIRLLESMKIDRVIVLDLHSIKIPEFFHVPLIHLSALPLFAQKIKNLLNSKYEARNSKQIQNTNDENTKKVSGFDIRDSILVSPDMGGLRRIKEMSELLDGMPWFATVKDRDLDTGQISIEKIDYSESGLNESDLRGKRALIVDDMISSGGTIIKSAELLKKKGVEQVYVFITHAIFSDHATKHLQESVIDKVFVTDTVLVPEEKKFEKLETLSVGEMIARELKK